MQVIRRNCDPHHRQTDRCQYFAWIHGVADRRFQYRFQVDRDSICKTASSCDAS